MPPAKRKRELQKFTKWNGIPEKLKIHVIGYLDNKKRLNFSQCSKKSNEEFQKLYPYVPKSIDIDCSDMKNEKISIHVRMTDSIRVRHYKFFDAGKNKHQYVEGSYKLGVRTTGYMPCRSDLTFEGSALKGAFEFLNRMYKDKEQRSEPSYINLDLKVWPAQLTNFLENVQLQIYSFHIKMNMLIYKGFMNLAKDAEKMKLEIDCENNFQLPPVFYQSTLFKKIESFTCATDKMTDDDFIGSNASYLKITNKSISNAAINQKIKKWFSNPTDTFLYFSVNNGNISLANKKELFKGLPVQKLKKNSKSQFTLWKENGKHAHINIFDAEKAIEFDCRYQ